MKTEPYRSRSLAPGLLISLLIHAGLAALLLSPRPVQHSGQPVRWLTVSLLPTPSPKAEPAPVPTLLPPPAAASRPPAASRTRPAVTAQAPAAAPARKHDKDQEQDARRAPAAITAIAATPASPATPATPVVPAAAGDPPDPFAAQPAKPAGAFDTAAALKSARKLAVARAGKDDPAVAQLRDKPASELASDNELGKGIKQGVRPDCLTSAAGAGILAPLLIAAQVLTDKKDHGCKW